MQVGAGIRHSGAFADQFRLIDSLNFYPARKCYFLNEHSNGRIYEMGNWLKKKLYDNEFHLFNEFEDLVKFPHYENIGVSILDLK